MIAAIEGRVGTETYDGYTSCPLITRVGRAMLVEFDYKNNFVPSFSGMIAVFKEIFWRGLFCVMALIAAVIRAAYVYVRISAGGFLYAASRCV